MKKARTRTAALTPKQIAGQARRADCNADDFHGQSRELRAVASELEQVTAEIVESGRLRFEMDGLMSFDRADELLRGHLTQVNRAIGKAQYS
jgi:hypothetical protein